MKRLLLLTTLTATLTATLAAPLLAQTGDAQPVDAAQLLNSLKLLRDQNEAGLKSRRLTALQSVSAAATSNEKAVAYWKDAVKAVQFEGAEKEGAQLRDWREGDGEALSDRLCAGAVRLHLQWLALSLQHSSGVEIKILLPKVLEHIAAVQADELAAEHLQDQLEKAKDRNPASPGARKVLKEDSVVRKVHDQIMRTSVASGPVAKLLRIGDLLEGGGGGADRLKGREGREGRGGGGAPEAVEAAAQPLPGKGPGALGTVVAPKQWEFNPGNIDGIYNRIVLPEYRAAKDPRLLDYWDMVLKRETEKAADKKLDVEQRDWAQIKKPRLQWQRAQDVMVLGQRNRAILEMFNLAKGFPNHPEAAGWIGQLEGLLSPTAATTTSTEPLPPPLIPGVPTVPAPARVPAAIPAVAPGPAPVLIPGVPVTPSSATPGATRPATGTGLPPSTTRPAIPPAR